MRIVRHNYKETLRVVSSPQGNQLMIDLLRIIDILNNEKLNDIIMYVSKINALKSRDLINSKADTDHEGTS